MFTRPSATCRDIICCLDSDDQGMRGGRLEGWTSRPESRAKLNSSKRSSILCRCKERNQFQLAKSAYADGSQQFWKHLALDRSTESDDEQIVKQYLRFYQNDMLFAEICSKSLWHGFECNTINIYRNALDFWSLVCFLSTKKSSDLLSCGKYLYKKRDVST